MTSAQQITVLGILDKIPRKVDSPVAIDAIRRFLPILLTEIQSPPIETEAELSINRIGIWRPKWKMIFLWQCPQMFMSYSVILFLAGLIVLVCTPLIEKQPWGPESNVGFQFCSSSFAIWHLSTNSDEQTAVIFLSMTGFAFASFVFCSFWVYHYLDLEYYDTLPERALHEDDSEKVAHAVSENGPLGFGAGILR